MTDAAKTIAELEHPALAAEANERLKHQITLVDRGVQSLMLVNGGAMIALFSLLGKTGVAIRPDWLWLAFGFFAAGLVCTLAATMAAFLSQQKFYLATVHQLWDTHRVIAGEPKVADTKGLMKRGNSAMTAGIVAACFALLNFCIGCGFAFAGVIPA